MRLVIYLDDYPGILKDAHEGSIGIHVAQEKIVKCILWDGVWWPTLSEDATKYVSKCEKCQKKPPLANITLYHVQTIPKWSEHDIE